MGGTRTGSISTGRTFQGKAIRDRFPKSGTATPPEIKCAVVRWHFHGNECAVQRCAPNLQQEGRTIFPAGYRKQAGL